MSSMYFGITRDDAYPPTVNLAMSVSADMAGATVIFLPPPSARLLGQRLVATADAMERPLRPVRVFRIDAFTWSFSCTHHATEDIGLWHDQPAAYQAASAHVRTHHQEQPA